MKLLFPSHTLYEDFLAAAPPQLRTWCQTNAKVWKTQVQIEPADGDVPILSVIETTLRMVLVSAGTNRRRASTERLLATVSGSPMPPAAPKTTPVPAPAPEPSAATAPVAEAPPVPPVSGAPAQAPVPVVATVPTPAPAPAAPAPATTPAPSPEPDRYPKPVNVIAAAPAPVSDSDWLEKPLAIPAPEERGRALLGQLFRQIKSGS